MEPFEGLVSECRLTLGNCRLNHGGILASRRLGSSNTSVSRRAVFLITGLLIIACNKSDLSLVERPSERWDHIRGDWVGEDEEEADRREPPGLGDANGLHKLSHQWWLQCTARDADDHQRLTSWSPLVVASGGAFKDHWERRCLEEHDHDGDDDGRCAGDGGARCRGSDCTSDEAGEDVPWLEDLGAGDETGGGEAAHHEGDLGE